MLYDYFLKLFHMQGHKIHAMLGSKLFNKLEFSLKEDAIFIMYNF